MENQGSRIGIILLTIILTAVIVGAGVFFLQQNSIKELRDEIRNLQTATDKDAADEKPIADEKVTIPEATDKTPGVKTPYTKENTASLPADVEWLTYSDNDITFTYPRTFLGTSMQEDFDRNFIRDQWEVTREDNTIEIRPNFESPAAEFGATFQIEIIPTLKEAERINGLLTATIEGPESDKGVYLDDLNNQGYDVNFYQDVAMEAGSPRNIYQMIPKLVNGKQTPPWITILSDNVYQDYVKDILIPGIKVK